VSALKRYGLTLLLGVSLPILAALYAGGENVAQLGLRLAAVEQGVALAQRHWTFDAVPDHEAEAVALNEPVTVKKPTRGKR
jgi:hypothetical protein